MRIALVVPPFIAVPPRIYGGTELFVAHLAEGLKRSGFDVVVYANGESTLDAEVRWIYEESEWPIASEIYATLKDIDHTAWAIKDAMADCDLIHVNNAPGISYSQFAPQPFVYTVHHPKEQGLSDFYLRYPNVQYVTISDHQKSLEAMPHMQTIHHGLDLSLYRYREHKQPYLSFLGRFAPVKGAHLAIEIAKKAGIPLKLAGEVQPIYQSYFESQIKPHIDGKFIEYVGEADLAAKNELLGNSMALLFPIQWNEPFGFVMLEAMACGTPVLALPGGSVPEVVKDGVSGYMGNDVDALAARVRDMNLSPLGVRRYAEQHFSAEIMVQKYVALYREIAGGSVHNAGSGSYALGEKHRTVA